MIKQITVDKFGPIRQANIELGDLTIFVGPQATGKTILLQLYKLIEDIDYIRLVLKNSGYNWEEKVSIFLEVYFGEGMGSLNTKFTHIKADKYGSIQLDQFLHRKLKPKCSQKCFYIPAQRFLTMENGWPKSFDSYDTRYPYVMREFSSVLNKELQPYTNKDSKFFPMKGKLKSQFKDQISESVFESASLILQNEKGRSSLVLGLKDDDTNRIPLTAVSTGQREFIPFLLGLYHLLPGGKVTKEASIHTVIIEEIEMGLHPKAIGDSLLLILDILQRGYRVVLSTHSTDILNYIWAIKHIIHECKSDSRAVKDYIKKLFKVPDTSSATDQIAHKLIQAAIKLYYFKPVANQSEVIDISSLDIEDENSDVREWGGLTEFSSNVAEVVSDLYSRD